MKCKVICLRTEGVAIPRHSIRAQYPIEGDLEILDMRDEGVSRVIKTARLMEKDKRVRKMLFDPHIVWMSDRRFTLAGFERILHEGRVIEYAQSWLCTVMPEPVPDPVDDRH